MSVKRFFCDAAYNSKESISGVGLFDHRQGDSMIRAYGLYDCNHAELLALFLTMKKAHLNSEKEIEIVTDSDHAKRLFSNDKEPKDSRPKEKALLAEMKAFSREQFSTVDVTVVKGHRALKSPENTHCDYLAKQAMKGNGNVVEMFL